MTSQLLFVVLFCLSAFSMHGQDKLVDVPFTIVDGYGPFYPKQLGIHWNDPTKPSAWSGTHRILSGIPKNWQQVKQASITLDMYQSVYQNAMMGKLTPAFYQELQTSWGWTPDTATLSAKPIKCTVQVATGVDSSGQSWLLLDGNNNGNFADDQPFIVASQSMMAIINGNINVPPLQRVQFEQYRNGHIISLQTSITFSQFDDQIRYHFPQYGVASLQALGSPKLLTLCADGFIKPTFATADIVVLDDTINTRRKARINMSKPGEYISIGSNQYKYRGVDSKRQVVQLAPVNPSDSLYSTQIGYKAHPILAPEFTSGKTLSLNDYRGRYVLIDFWGTWCAPCVGEIKYLKEVYAQTKREDLELIGVVCNDTPERLRAFLNKQGVTWPQVMATTDNKLT